MRILGILGAVLAAPAAAAVWGLAAGGGFAMPLGDYNECALASPVADFRFMYCLTPSWSVNATASYRFGHTPARTYGDVDAVYGALPVMVGPSYRFDFTPFIPYIGGGGAVAYGWATVPVAVPAPAHCSGPSYAVAEDRTALRWGIYAEGGTEYYLVPNAGIDFRSRAVGTWGGEALAFDDEPIDAGSYMAFDVVAGLFWYPAF
jgi:hypothetical protein